MSMHGISLRWLLEGVADVHGDDVSVVDLTLDSRAVTPGALFFALRGSRQHGLAFAAEALRRGARAILWEPDEGVDGPDAVESIYVAAIPELSRHVGRIADRFFDWPSSHLRVVGITGTNGKTTCAWLLTQAMEQLAGGAAYLGTLGAGPWQNLRTGTHTTPDAVSVHREFAALRAQGARFVAMEVSSHALAQERVAGVRFAAAAFTNLTRDHLDYHGSMRAYGEAKALLFTREHAGHLVINVGDEFGRELAQRLAGRADVTAVSAGATASVWLAPHTLYATAVRSDATGLDVEFSGSAGEGRLHVPLIGRFNAENILVVLALLRALGASLDAALDALAHCHAPPGRMQPVSGGPGKPTAVIDYAHTPDALAKVLAAAREHCAGLVWCVFGCGGDRDAGKRPLMGAVADELADRVILTDDNPRTEAPATITADIATAIKRRPLRIINDRREAIRTALSEAGSADLVLIAGKGHEDYQIYGERRMPFSDRLEVQRHFGLAA
jgi:UDP-N-acetylmuramoyl-L-alanyl-D-glutamate--2,6-diaminopimelate ligase